MEALNSRVSVCSQSPRGIYLNTGASVSPERRSYEQYLSQLKAGSLVCTRADSGQSLSGDQLYCPHSLALKEHQTTSTHPSTLPPVPPTQHVPDFHPVVDAQPLRSAKHYHVPPKGPQTNRGGSVYLLAYTLAKQGINCQYAEMNVFTNETPQVSSFS